MPESMSVECVPNTKLSLARYNLMPVLALLLLAQCGGCAIVMPALPTDVPGYGHIYSVQDQDRRPVTDGLLILRSTYPYGPPMIAGFEISGGKVSVPSTRAMRFSYTTLMDFPILWGMFMNPETTYIYPLAPGHRAEERYGYGNEGRYAIGFLKKAPDQILMLTAAPDEEAQNLEDVESEMKEMPIDQTEDDRRTRERVLAYIKGRLDKIGSQPAVRTTTASTSIMYP